MSPSAPQSASAPSLPDTAGVLDPHSGTHVTSVFRIGAVLPERPALVFEDPHGERTTQSYGELATAANRYAVALQRLGVRIGDCIAVLMPNSVEFMQLYFAAVQIGVYVAPINWHLSGSEVAYIVDNSESKVFIAHERFADAAQAAHRELTARPDPTRGTTDVEFFAVGEVPGFAPLGTLDAAVPDTARPADRTLGGPMLYTSGTTGRPKGVRRPLTGASPDAISYANYAFFAGFGIEAPDNVHLCGSPLYHTAVLNFVSISLGLGQFVVMMDKWTPERCLELLEEFGVTHSHMVPTQFVRLLELPEATREAFNPDRIRTIVHGAAPTPRHIKQAMLDWWGPKLTEYYAGTEGGGATITGPEWLRKPGSVGKPWPTTELSILDDDGNELPTGEVGNVYLHLRGSSFAYHKDQAKTESTYSGKLFTMGDIGYVDSDGYLFLLDRKNDMIISGGVNIYPAEVESVLQQHPAVRDVAVFGIPHPEWGEQVTAIVEVSPTYIESHPDPLHDVSVADALATEIIAATNGQLAAFKRPKTVRFVASLPREPNGKLLKRKLKAPFWEV